jgi:hypothetical protein
VYLLYPGITTFSNIYPQNELPVKLKHLPLVDKRQSAIAEVIKDIIPNIEAGVEVDISLSE